MLAASLRNTEFASLVIKVFVDAAGDLNAICDEGSTALPRALAAGNVTIANSLLFDYRVDPTLPDENGETALHYICRYNLPEPELLIQYLADRGLDVNGQSLDGTTPLYYAAQYGAINAARILFSRGVDPTAKDDREMTPIEIAICGSTWACIHLFLEEVER
ncbi:ankyrin repeat-containing domain protein [Aspergillus crustosus]